MDLFLSSDERYEVWTVKAAERPELLAPFGGGQTDNVRDENDVEHGPNHLPKDSKEMEDNESYRGTSFDKAALPPLTDGCDLESWRRHNFVLADENVLAVVNVGPGCPLLRRERQIPVVSNRSLQRWTDLRHRLMSLPKVDQTVAVIPSEAAEALPVHPWFERENVPAVLLGCTENWSAMETCRFDGLVRRFGEMPWRFSDTHGEMMSLRTYQKYLNSLEGQLDDAPLAVYDSQFHLDERAEILDDYEVPSCFRTDLFELVDEEIRPPYRWILIGPPRSGTGLHVDPAGTHAWVTLVQGLKRWVLFPPTACRRRIGMAGDVQIPSSIWFRDHYDRVMADAPGRESIHVLQRPGETVYVPAGWPHLVLNLELSVAITHNYATEYPSLPQLWCAVQCESEVASQLKDRLQHHRPELFAQIEPTNCR
jgi:histone arginine demethylase JMJD6